MAVDSQLIRLINERQYNPWLKEGRFRSDYQTYLPLPAAIIPDLRSVEVWSEGLWVGIDCGFSPDPTAIVIVKHMSMHTHYNARLDSGREYTKSKTTSLYRVVAAEELVGVTYPDQRDHVQKIIDREKSFNPEVSIVLDATGVGVAISQDWRNGLENYSNFIPVTITAGQPAKLRNKSVGDLLLGAMRVFEEGRCAIPKSSDFAIKKLYNQLTTREIETSDRGRLKAIDKRSSSMSHFDLSIALSLVIGHREAEDARFIPMMLV
jgi:hypothetical protein